MYDFHLLCSELQNQATDLGPHSARYQNVCLNSGEKALLLTEFQKEKFSVVHIHTFLGGKMIKYRTSIP